MKVAFIDLSREWNFFENEFLKVFQEFGKKAQYVLGPYTENFEKEFAASVGYRFAVGVSTGLTALETALRAYNIGEGDEVITVGNSAVATSLAISYVGAHPVFCDIRENYLIDPDKIEKLITPKTKAILPVHLFGAIADMRKINAIAQKYHLVIIEDACQAHGAKFFGENLINTKAYSFYPTKNLGALGEAGMILTNDEGIYKFAVAYRNYGQSGRYNHILKGNNYRIDPIQCALLSKKLSHLNSFIQKRQAIARGYVEHLREISDLDILPFDSTSAYHLFVVRVLSNRRDSLREYLLEQGVECLVHYPKTIYQQPCYAEYNNIKLDTTDRLQNEILSLPCYPFLTESEQTYILKKIKDFFMLGSPKADEKR